jgi:hypothetical protein
MLALRETRLAVEAHLADALFAHLLGTPVNIHVPSDEDYAYIEGFPLPASYSPATTDVLIELPYDYPATPPTKVYIDNGLGRHGETLKDYDQGITTRQGKSWASWRTDQIGSIVRTWQPDWDGLHTFLPMLLGSFRDAPTI